MTDGIRYSPIRFAVDERPICIWVADPQRHNREFLENYNPNYFLTLRDLYNGGVTEATQQEIALALRLAYAHALETLFSLLGATLQMHHFVQGWLLHYQVKDVVSLIRKIQNAEPIYSRFIVPLSSWQDVSRLIHIGMGDNDETERLKENFASLWAGLARDFIEIGKEYNSIKHGFRATPGGMEYRILPGGASSAPESDEEWDEWITIGSSEYGSRFVYTDKLVKYHFQLKEQQHNWHPRDMLHALTAIAPSLHNIICFLKLQNKLSETVMYKGLREEEAFKAPWKERPGIGVTSVDMNMGTLEADDITRFTRAQILSVYPTDEEE